MLPNPPRPTPRAAHRLWVPPRTAAYWLITVVLAITAGLVVTRSVAAAGEARASFGELRATVVATRDLPAGHRLRAGDVEIRHLPRVLLPARLPPTLDDAVGRILTAVVLDGEPVVSARLAPGGLSELAALVPPGSLAVAVPAGPGELRLRRGDRVDVLATLDLGEGDGAPTFAVARAAIVLDVTDDAVTIAVAEDEAPRVAYALVHGFVTLALRGSP